MQEFISYFVKRFYEQQYLPILNGYTATKRPAKRLVFLRIVCSLLYEVYIGELESVSPCNGAYRYRWRYDPCPNVVI